MDGAAGTGPGAVATRDGGRLTVACHGRFTIAFSTPLTAALAAIPLDGVQVVTVDLRRVAALDTAGAWLVYRFVRHARRMCAEVEVANATAAQRALLDRMDPKEDRRALKRPMVPPLRAMIERLGAATLAVLADTRVLVSFIGLTVLTLVRSLARPRRLRIVALFAHVERVGLDALPIVGLLSFLIGVVLAFQGADQLRPFGAEVFTVVLLGAGIFRELGVLMTSIMVAGRSGSAFAAEIGTMKVNEEIDAMQTLGIDPIEVLVIPRVLAMIVALPLLTFYADVVGLIGGAAMCWIELGITPYTFTQQLREGVSLTMLLVGLSKAPVFAFLIALVGCYQGLRVSGSAESVGRRTTTAVVQSVFLVIVADAGFSVVFSWLKI